MLSSIKAKMFWMLVLLGLAACAGFGWYAYWDAMNDIETEIREEAGNHLQRSVEMFMVSTRRFHDDFNAATDPAQRQKTLDDWNRTIFAVDQAVIADHGADKPRVRLIGDKSIFPYAPLGGDNTIISDDFERDAAQAIAGGAPGFETDFGGDSFKMAVPLPSSAHAGCAECHFATVEGLNADMTRDMVLGSLNVYMPLTQRMSEVRTHVFGVIAALALVFALILAAIYLFTDRAVVRPIQRAAEMLRDVAQGEGDLTQRLAVTSKDEIGRLAEYFNAFSAKLQGTIVEIVSTAKSLGRSTEDLSGAAGTLDKTSLELLGQAQVSASAVEESSANIKNIAAAIEESNANANVVAASAEEISANLHAVAAAVEQMSANMDNIGHTADGMAGVVTTAAAAVEEMSASLGEVARNSAEAAQVASRASTTAQATSASVDALGQAAQEIGKVVDVIKSIAAKTNLLALNATIEAASAGDAGKGFAVVANEVKELAKQTASATEDIRGQVEGMQGRTREAVSAIREIASVVGDMDRIGASIAAAVEEQTATTNEIARNIANASHGADDVTRNVKEAAKGASEVSRNVQEAVTGVNEIARNIAELASGMSEMAHATAEGAIGTSQAASAAESVHMSSNEAAAAAVSATIGIEMQLELSARLSSLTSGFKVGTAKFDIAAVKAAHLKWRMRLEQAIRGFAELTVREVVSPHDCAFGKWYYGPEARAFEQFPVFAEIGRHHEQVHGITMEIAKLLERKDRNGAERKLKEFEEARHKMFDALDRLYRA